LIFLIALGALRAWMNHRLPTVASPWFSSSILCNFHKNQARLSSADMAQLFTVDYPKGDRGGNEICIRVTQTGQSMDLHRFWDGAISSSQNLTRLRNEATALRTRQEFQQSQLTELASNDFKSWAKESFRLRRRLLTSTVN